jgi:two-component system cell cycle response regulator DivK
MVGNHNPAPTSIDRFTSLAGASTAPVRILVVDDHDDTRLMLRTLLEMQNFVVLEAIDGEAALEVAVSHRPDLILMDLTLPKVDGLMATRLIRGHEAIGTVPIVFLSGRAEPSRRQAAIEAGCNDYLVKPVDVDDMLVVMARWLNSNIMGAAQGPRKG